MKSFQEILVYRVYQKYIDFFFIKVTGQREIVPRDISIQGVSKIYCFFIKVAGQCEIFPRNVGKQCVSKIH